MRNVFQGDKGKYYSFTTTLETTGVHDPSTPSEPFLQILDTEQIFEFRYENKMNELIQTAQLAYLDKNGVIDRFSSYQYVRVYVNMSKIDIKTDGKVKIEESAKGESINLQFYIDNIEINDSKPQEIMYTLHLVGVNTLALNQICRYTSYPDRISITDHIQTMMKNASIQFDGKTFADNASNAKISYISNGSDTIHDSIRYLQRKQYYQGDMDETLKMIIFNDRKNQYCLFDCTKDSDWQTLRSFKVNMIKNRGDIFSSEDRTNIAFVGNKPNTETYKSQFPKHIWRYDIEGNTFDYADFQTKSILNLGGKGNKREQEQEGYYTTSQSYWNNDQNIYAEQIENAIDNSGLKINVAGVVGIVPGDRIGIAISYDGNTTTQDAKEKKKYDSKFTSFGGDWFASRVVYRVLPHYCKFRQIISLMKYKDIDVLDSK